MEQFSTLLEIIVKGNGNYVLMTIRHTDIEIESDTQSSIFAELADNLPNISALFVKRPCFYEKLGLLHIRKIAFDGSYHKFGCLVSGVLKPLVREKLLLEVPALTKQDQGEHVLYASCEEIKNMLANMRNSHPEAVPSVFTANRSTSCSVVVEKNIFKKASVIGQFNKEFIIVSHGDCVFAIDQHALHERILLESLLSEHYVDMYAQSDDIEELKSMACRNAVRFGQELPRERLLKLVRSMVLIKFPTACAHGRLSVCVLMTKNASRDKDACHPPNCSM